MVDLLTWRMSATSWVESDLFCAMGFLLHVHSYGIILPFRHKYKANCIISCYFAQFFADWPGLIK